MRPSLATAPPRARRPAPAQPYEQDDAGLIATASDPVRFSWHDFSRVRELLLAATGIALSAEKKAMVYVRLVKRVRALGLGGFAEYVALLEDPSHPEWDGCVSALTTNLTSFFREPHHFPILAQLASTTPRSQPFAVWSAGCASGEEPYSIAMCLAEAFGRIDCPIHIAATDIDTRVLARARSGVYQFEAVEQLPAPRVRRFFLRGAGEQIGRVRVRAELAQLIAFSRLNLSEERWDISGPFDAIFCRNVMIYLDRTIQRRVLERFAALLKPHGLLFAGHSENLFFNAADLFRPRGKTVYERVASHA